MEITADLERNRKTKGAEKKREIEEWAEKKREMGEAPAPSLGKPGHPSALHSDVKSEHTPADTPTKTGRSLRVRGVGGDDDFFRVGRIRRKVVCDEFPPGSTPSSMPGRLIEPHSAPVCAEVPLSSMPARPKARRPAPTCTPAPV